MSIAKHKYEVNYSSLDLGAVGPPPPDVTDVDFFSKSLLERAGLETRKIRQPKGTPEPGEDARYDITNDEPGQIRFRNHPV